MACLVCATLLIPPVGLAAGAQGLRILRREYRYNPKRKQGGILLALSTLFILMWVGALGTERKPERVTDYSAIGALERLGRTRSGQPTGPERYVIRASAKLLNGGACVGLNEALRLAAKENHEGVMKLLSNAGAVVEQDTADDLAEEALDCWF